jgi:threonine dehydrogenase-like Zn-dependent dehydrogenase
VRALCWEGINKVAVENVRDASILNPHDAVVKVKYSSACGSDLHLLGGYVPAMRKGDIFGHEYIGEIVETGPEVKNFKKGDRVLGLPIIACGNCFFCEHDEWSMCDNTNPNAWMPEAINGHAGAAILGYSRIFGGYAGSHAEYVRIPLADRNVWPLPDSVSDEDGVFISDALPTGFMAAEFCGIQPGDTIAVWGCGGVGQMAVASAWLLGAKRVIAVDRVPERLAMAKDKGGAEVVNFESADVFETLLDMTGGRGPDACIDAVGTESVAAGPLDWYDKAKQAVRLETDRPNALRQILRCVRKAGRVSVVGTYAGYIDKFPMSAVINKNLTLRAGQCSAQRYVGRMIDYVGSGRLKPSYMLTHLVGLEQGDQIYQAFKHKQDNCVRPVFKT